MLQSNLDLTYIVRVGVFVCVQAAAERQLKEQGRLASAAPEAAAGEANDGAAAAAGDAPADAGDNAAAAAADGGGSGGGGGSKKGKVMTAKEKEEAQIKAKRKEIMERAGVLHCPTTAQLLPNYTS